jgi:membrane fusion protein, multidrug efflux system
MVTIMIIVYTALVALLFKFKILKLRPFPIAWVAVCGVVLIGGIVVAWHLCAPMSSRVVTTQYVVQLVSYVKGQVLTVHAQPNQPVKKGDLLLEINPENYQYEVSQASAQLVSAKDNVHQSGAALESAQANTAKAKSAVTQARATVAQAAAAVVNARSALTKSMADDELAKTDETIAVGLQKTDPGAISELKVAKAVQNRQAADAAVAQAQAGVNEALAGKQQADAGLGVAQAGEQQAVAAERQATFALQIAKSNVNVVQAQLDTAQFNLRECKMLAPADGFVVDWQVQDGTMISTVRASACGTFIVTTETFIAASFPQNYLMNVQTGDDVEVVLDPYPGRVFKAKVDAVIAATGEGQYAPSGTIPEASKVGSQGLLAVKIRFVEEDPPPKLPLGAGGSVAIYTDHGKPVHIISKVTIRMRKWLLYVLPA